MIAGAYLRKSQDEVDKDAADKSVTRQLTRTPRAGWSRRTC